MNIDSRLNDRTIVSILGELLSLFVRIEIQIIGVFCSVDKFSVFIHIQLQGEDI